METRNIFIDTSIFIQQGYDYSSTLFAQLRRLAKAKQAAVFVTDIVVSEIHAHIESDLSDAISKFRSKAKALKTLDDEPYNMWFNDSYTSHVIDKLNVQLATFLTEIGATTLSTDEVSSKDVFVKYFAKQLPFGHSKKKSEFPDAFTLAALEKWCVSQRENMYVASTDTDLIKYCFGHGQLFEMASLAKFISLVEHHDEVLTPAIEKLFEEAAQQIQESIKDKFLRESFWLKNADGTVDNISVISASIDEIYILEVDSNAAVVNVGVSIDFTADITAVDPNATYYYGEDDFFTYPSEISIRQTKKCMATISIKHDISNSEEFEIETIDFDGDAASGFWIYVDEHAWR